MNIIKKCNLQCISIYRDKNELMELRLILWIITYRNINTFYFDCSMSGKKDAFISIWEIIIILKTILYPTQWSTY